MVKLPRLRYPVGPAAFEHHVSYAHYHFQKYTRNLFHSLRVIRNVPNTGSSQFHVRKIERQGISTRASYTSDAIGDWPL
jgi:hypothetical protein